MEGSGSGGAFARLEQAESLRRCGWNPSASKSLEKPGNLDSLGFVSFWKAEN